MKLVTRTFETLVCSVMFVNIASGTIETRTLEIPSSVPEKKRLAYCVQFASKDERVVDIKSSTIKTTLYGMSEADFLKYAKELPPRTKAEQ